jgi:hypothetical protein
MITQAQAVGTVHRYHQRLDEIRTDPNLSDDGRCRFVALEWVAARSVVDGYHADRRQRRDDEVSTARRRLFGTPLDTGPLGSLSARDARDRAKRAAEAGLVHQLIGEALHTGDRTLGLAAVELALGAGDLDSLNRWITRYPQDEKPLQLLVDAGDRQAELQRDMHEHMLAPSPALPPELSDVGEAAAVELAGSEAGVRTHIAQVLGTVSVTAGSAA